MFMFQDDDQRVYQVTGIKEISINRQLDEPWCRELRCNPRSKHSLVYEYITFCKDKKGVIFNNATLKLRDNLHYYFKLHTANPDHQFIEFSGRNESSSPSLLFTLCEVNPECMSSIRVNGAPYFCFTLDSICYNVIDVTYKTIDPSTLEETKIASTFQVHNSDISFLRILYRLRDTNGELRINPDDRFTINCRSYKIHLYKNSGVIHFEQIDPSNLKRIDVLFTIQAEPNTF